MKQVWRRDSTVLLPLAVLLHELSGSLGSLLSLLHLQVSSLQLFDPQLLSELGLLLVDVDLLLLLRGEGPVKVEGPEHKRNQRRTLQSHSPAEPELRLGRVPGSDALGGHGHGHGRGEAAERDKRLLLRAEHELLDHRHVVEVRGHRGGKFVRGHI